VSNLPYTATSTDIQTLFSDIAPVRSAFVVLDKETKVSKGVAYVAFAIKEDAELAMKNETPLEVDGRVLRLQWADRKVSIVALPSVCILWNSRRRVPPHMQRRNHGQRSKRSLVQRPLGIQTLSERSFSPTSPKVSTLKFYGRRHAKFPEPAKSSIQFRSVMNIRVRPCQIDCAAFTHFAVNSVC
jgi:RNA recognition motif-containing protein